MEKPKVHILIGSDSDLPVVEEAVKVLKGAGVGAKLDISSAHRNPEKTIEYARRARDDGFEVIIAAAGLAAHLPGVLASHTTLPVIGIPMGGGALGGMDAVLSILQMPGGVPVATVAIGKAGAKNAALLAIQMLAIKDVKYKACLEAFRKQMSAKVLTDAKTVSRYRTQILDFK